MTEASNNEDKSSDLETGADAARVESSVPALDDNAASSDPEAGEQDAQPKGVASPFSVVGIGFGLLLIVSTLLSQLPQPVASIDAAELLGQRFSAHEQPFGFPVMRAERYRAGEEFLTFGVAADVEAEDERLAAKKIVCGGDMEGRGGWGGGGHGAHSGMQSTRDWTALFLDREGGEPLEVGLVWYPLKLAKKVLPKQFGSVQYTDIGELGDKGGVALIESGSLDWWGYQVHYRLERHFELHDGEPAFRDKLRANLSLGTLGNVIHLRWPVGVLGDKEALATALKAFEPAS
ncbi:MAG: hypothetical protein ACI841_000822 [Planctomycetota bacterium]|jgi:hypothetical protein